MKSLCPEAARNEGDQQQPVSEGGALGGGDDDDVRDDLLEVNYVIWFDVTIEGEIQRERFEFGF